MSNEENTTGSTLRALERNLASMTEAGSVPPAREAAPVTARRSPVQPMTAAKSWENFVGDDADEIPRTKARKKVPVTTAPSSTKAPARPTISEPIALFNIAYEVLRNARDCRDPQTPEMARTVYALDIADKRDSWPQTKVALMAFVKAHAHYVMSIDGKARWGQFVYLGN